MDLVVGSLVICEKGYGPFSIQQEEEEKGPYPFSHPITRLPNQPIPEVIERAASTADGERVRDRACHVRLRALGRFNQRMSQRQSGGHRRREGTSRPMRRP